MDSKQEKELRETDAGTEEYLYLRSRDVQHFLLEMCGNLEGEDLLPYIAHSRQEAARYKREREAEYARARKAVANLDPITRVRRIAKDVYNPYDCEHGCWTWLRRSTATWTRKRTTCCRMPCTGIHS
jgi:hypothetical protein